MTFAYETRKLKYCADNHQARENGPRLSNIFTCRRTQDNERLVTCRKSEQNIYWYVTCFYVDTNLVQVGGQILAPGFAPVRHWYVGHRFSTLQEDFLLLEELQCGEAPPRSGGVFFIHSNRFLTVAKDTLYFAE